MTNITNPTTAETAALLGILGEIQPRDTGAAEAEVEWSAWHDDYFDTWSIHRNGYSVADLWRLDEETHDRHPNCDDSDAEETAKYMARACECFPAMLDALSECQAALSLLVEPDAIRSSSVLGTFAAATKAEAVARAAIAKAKGGNQS